KPLVYNTRPEGCQETARRRRHAPQFLASHRLQTVSRLIFLTLQESGPYTHRMARQRLLYAAVALAACVLVWPGALGAQAIQRAMYVSVVNDAGAPVPDLGPADFVIREDNATREVLRVVPAEDPMQVALLVDTSAAARDDIAHMRTALPPFIATLTGGEGKNQVTIIAIGE